MIDRRPHLIDSFLTGLFRDLDDREELQEPPSHRARRRERWREILLERFDDGAIPFPGGVSSGRTSNGDVVSAFLSRYPKLEGLVLAVKELAQQQFPSRARVEIAVASDPETCGICTEKQTLVMNVEVDGLTDDEEADFDAKMFDLNCAHRHLDESLLLVVHVRAATSAENGHVTVYIDQLGDSPTSGDLAFKASGDVSIRRGPVVDLSKETEWVMISTDLTLNPRPWTEEDVKELSDGVKRGQKS